MTAELTTLLPKPVAVQPLPGRFRLDEATTVHASGDAVPAARWWTERVRAATGLPLTESGVDGAVSFHVNGSVPEPEGYRLTITPERITVVATDADGARHAARTLRQLLGPDALRAAPVRREWSLPCGTVTDHPRLGWRGCLLDVARHFLPKADVLRFVDLLAEHKLNVLHLHLTDDQGWRLEVPRYPRLTEVGAWRTESTLGHPPGGRPDGRPHGGYYSTADLREIVGYAAARGITVVPEVDVPGHVQAALAAYPELGNTGEPLPVWTSWGVSPHLLNPAETTVEFFRAVFDQVTDVFDAPVIAVGGDEVPTGEWERSDVARDRAAELGLPDVRALHGWFVGRMAAHLATRGRRVLGWDELTEVGELPPGAIVGSWRGERAGIRAARAGFDVVMCPEQYVYLDHRQSERPDEPVPVGFPRSTADVYAYQPVPPELTAEEARHVLGAQAQIWTEHLDSARRIDYAAFPRLAAFAEVVWTPDAARDPAEFDHRLLTEHLPRLAALGVEHRPPAGPLPWQTRPGLSGKPRKLHTIE